MTNRKKIVIDLFEITFTKPGRYDKVFRLQSHARLSSLSLCCLEKPYYIQIAAKIRTLKSSCKMNIKLKVN